MMTWLGREGNTGKEARSKREEDIRGSSVDILHVGVTAKLEAFKPITSE